MREGTVGSDAFKQAVDRELRFFEEELQADLVRLAALQNAPLAHSGLVARAITRLVFAMGATALDLPPDRDGRLVDEISAMVQMIILGARAAAASAHDASGAGASKGSSGTSRPSGGAGGDSRASRGPVTDDADDLAACT